MAPELWAVGSVGYGVRQMDASLLKDSESSYGSSSSLESSDFLLVAVGARSHSPPLALTLRLCVRAARAQSLNVW